MGVKGSCGRWAYLANTTRRECTRATQRKDSDMDEDVGMLFLYNSKISSGLFSKGETIPSVFEVRAEFGCSSDEMRGNAGK